MRITENNIHISLTANQHTQVIQRIFIQTTLAQKKKMTQGWVVNGESPR